MRKQRYSEGLETRKEVGFQRRYVFRKRKNAVEDDLKNSWSGVEVQEEVE